MNDGFLIVILSTVLTVFALGFFYILYLRSELKASRTSEQTLHTDSRLAVKVMLYLKEKNAEEAFKVHVGMSDDRIMVDTARHILLAAPSMRLYHEWLADFHRRGCVPSDSQAIGNAVFARVKASA